MNDDDDDDEVMTGDCYQEQAAAPGERTAPHLPILSLTCSEENTVPHGTLLGEEGMGFSGG